MSCQNKTLTTVNEIDFKVEKIKFRTIVKSLIIFSSNSVNFNLNSKLLMVLSSLLYVCW